MKETFCYEEISMFGYAEAYDIFEVKANLFMNEFRKSRYFYVHCYSIIYEDDGIVHNTELVLNECKKITIETLDPNSLEPKVPFYVFFYKLKKETKDKLQQAIINKYFIEKFVNEFVNERKPEYIDENCIELIPMPKKLLAPPQTHLKLVEEIYNKCPLHIYKDMNTLLQIRNALKKKLQGGGSH
uniref:Uncharacterized protein n=1 Tax=Meloidogyne enterolobii TaxID=390850 RepID=A0A6V7W1Z0_MELEN|nr:unnamed protein product [Meloidogyne enterolobii]